jgi:hypothetical protein
MVTEEEALGLADCDELHVDPMTGILGDERLNG